VSEPKPRGRPKDMDKRAAIVRAAHRLFLQRGFEAVKIEEVAEVANVSKMTVYANFEEKAAMFEAVVEQQTEKMEQSFSQIRMGEGRVETVLVQVGTTLMSFLLSSEVMRFDQMLGVEMNHHPGFSRRFYDAGPNRMWIMLTSIIEAAVHRNELNTENTRRAAEDLIALWLGNVPLQHRFNALETLTVVEIEARVVRGVGNFMKIYGMPVKQRAKSTPVKG
jgi:TetR/AcrR family transcriptional regulator, mexJK operon transcriptional repressor